MGELNFFLGLQVKQSKKGTLISQQKYIKELLKRFDMEASKVIDTPIVTATRLDMDEPVFDLIGYVDIDYAGYLVDKKSTSRMAHFLGSCLISWGTRKQNFVLLSIVEVEYVVVASCCAQLLWIKQQLEDFRVDTLDDYKANKHLKLYTPVKKAKLTDKRSVREPGSPDTG
uniref:Uncharacterized mitochondrial protein AtMg00810-like n=1 Tax=Nicotiana tabacum TaxID=4097 RepID=A0A1S4DAU1_TOBAC|nr:PREDICTED: uncharacterized mitochondrial protein AtMg00810-like [Nicotiana tabacum]